MKFFIPEYMDRMSDIKFKWYHCEMKSCYWKRDLYFLFFGFVANFRPQKENCGTWNQRFGRAPKVTWTHWIVWPVRCNCQACVGGTIFSLFYEAQLTTPGSSCSQGWKYYLLDDSIGFGSICLLDSSIHPLNNWPWRLEVYHPGRTYWSKIINVTPA